MGIAEYTRSEGGPLSWASVNKNIASASDAQFKHHAEAFYGRKTSNGLFSKLAQMFQSDTPATPRSIQRPGIIQGPAFGEGWLTDSPLFDNPGGFYRPLTNEEDIRLRASAQQAMEAGRPMTIAEMYGKPQQLFTTLRGLGEDTSLSKSTLIAAGIGALIGTGAHFYLKTLKEPSEIQESLRKLPIYFHILGGAISTAGAWTVSETLSSMIRSKIRPAS